VPFRNEDDLVRWLQRRWPDRATNVRLGIGDDAAIVSVTRGSEFALTTDLSIEGVHFRRDLHPPRAVGHRALARALSDLAAVGARPRFALVSLAFPPATRRSWVSGFYDGAGVLARRHGVALIGGDTAVAEGGGIVVDVVAAGEVKRGLALRRDGARPGDLLYVTGRLGMAALGLEMLKSNARRASTTNRRAEGGGIVRQALGAHLYPEPRLGTGRYLAAHRLASAAIDVSDGFARDLGRLCAASACAAIVREESLPLPRSGTLLTSSTGRPRQQTVREARLDPLELALRGGEDYELIFTVPRPRAGRLPRSIKGVALHQIGEIRRGRGLRLLLRSGSEVRLAPRGYDHFRRAR